MSKPDIAAIIAAAKKSEQDRIVNLIKTVQWSGDSLAEDITNLEALIKGENK